MGMNIKRVYARAPHLVRVILYVAKSGSVSEGKKKGNALSDCLVDPSNLTKPNPVPKFVKISPVGGGRKQKDGTHLANLDGSRAFQVA